MRGRLASFVTALAVAAATTGSLRAETVAFVGGTVVVGDGSEPIPGGTVIIRDGRIVSAGRAVPPPANARIVDVRGKWITPGLVAGFTRLGLVNVDAVDQTNDVAAQGSPFSASIDVAPAINPEVPAIAISRAAGVTRAIVAPGNGPTMFAGEGAVIDTGDDMDPITRDRAFQFVEFGEDGAEKAGGTRPAAHAWFRNALSEASDYARDPGRYDGRSKDSLLLRRDAAALVPVIEGRIPLLVHVESGADILQMLALRRSYPGIRLVLVGAAEGWTVARQIAAAGVPVIASALNDLPASFEMIAATQSNIGRMRAAGVRVGMGMINNEDALQPRWSTQYAGNLVGLSRIPGASGLSWGQAFATISSEPAEIIGLGGEIGSLRPQRRADVVVWSGDPLELVSIPEAIWIDGKPQPLTNRQTRLRDRYRVPATGALPPAYRH